MKHSVNRRRAVLVVVCAVVLLSVLASSAYMAHEAAFHHCCVGANCPVCLFIAQVELMNRGLGLALLALALVCLVLAPRRAATTPALAGAPAPCTLVGRRIRLND